MGGTVGNTLKGGRTENWGGKTKILKRGGQAGPRGGCLKKWGGRGGGWNPLTNYEYLTLLHNHCIFIIQDVIVAGCPIKSSYTAPLGYATMKH